MNFPELIAYLNDKGVNINLANDELNVSAPAGSMNSEILGLIKEHKQKFISMLLNGIPKAEIKDSYCMSPAQKRFWILSKFDDVNGSYNIPVSLKISGHLDINILQEALNVLIRRHEVLRTVFRENKEEEVSQFIIKVPQDCTVVYEKINQKYEIDEFIRKENSYSFNLSEFPLIRVTVLEVGINTFILNILMHHIISDAWSLKLFFKELLGTYLSLINNISINASSTFLNYKDYSEWLNKGLQNKKFLESEKFWVDLFSHEILDVNLPIAKRRPLQKTFSGKTCSIDFNEQVYIKLKSFCKNKGISTLNTFVAVVNAILYRYTSQKDLIIGIPISGRTRSATKDIIGLLINSLPIYTQISDEETFESLVLKESKLLTDVYMHQDFPFELLVEKLKIIRDPGRSPLFDIMVTSEEEEENLFKGYENTDLEIEFIEAEVTTCKFDLIFRFVSNKKGLSLKIDYNTDLFDDYYIERLLKHIINFTGQAIDNPSKRISAINLLSKEEENIILDVFNNTSASYNEKATVISLIEDQATKYPNKTGITYYKRSKKSKAVFERKTLTYEQLSKKSNQIARLLQLEFNIETGDLVGVLLDKSEWLIPVLLGILKTGSAYVPIDPNYPSDRKEYFKTFCECKMIIDDEKLSYLINSLIKYESDSLDIVVLPDQLLHVMFTSGSTGIPKGVMINHRNIVGLTTSCTYMDLNQETVLLSSVSVSFDTTNIEFWGVLINGGSVILEDKEYLLDYSNIKKTIIENSINTFWLTSSWFESVIDNDITVFSNLSQFLTGGDIVSYPHINLLRSTYPELKIICGYGPTEDTTFSTTFRVKEILNDNIPIGKPIDNGNAYILNEDLVPQPIGVVGTLFLGGVGLSSGYYKNPSLTEQKFIESPLLKNKKIYNTGDLARWMPDGNIDFIGRQDRQVKIRGKIVDTSEIENVLSENPAIKQSVVMVQKIDNDKKIIAYLMLGDVIDYSVLKQNLKDRLPLHMVPFLFVDIPVVPLSPNGKTDFRALSQIDLKDYILNQEFIVPTSKIEKDLADIWKEVLLIKDISIKDNFFELGGHSLMAFKLISRINNKFDIEFSIADFFSNPTIEECAEFLRKGAIKKQLPLIKSEIYTDKIPLSFAQERLWFIDKFEGSQHFHVPIVLKIEGNLNIEYLSETFIDIFNRHQILRTVFEEIDGVPFQKILSNDGWGLETIDLVSGTDNFEKLILEEINRPFDLSTDMLTRVLLIKESSDKFFLTIVMHHIVTDGWSNPIFINELVEIYKAKTENRVVDLPELPIQYADFSVWQKKFFNHDFFLDKLEYWIKKLSDVNPLVIPTDFPRLSDKKNIGSSVTIPIDIYLSDKITLVAKQEGVTLFMFLIASLKVLLHKYSGQDDICIGTVVANRNQKETEPLLGFFVNSIPMRAKIERSGTFKHLLEQVKQTTIEGFSNQDVPFEKIVEEIVKERDINRSPIFQVLMSLQNNDTAGKVDLQDIKITEVAQNVVTSKLDMTFNILQGPSGLSINTNYNSSLFNRSTIEQINNHYIRILNIVTERVSVVLDEIEILSDGEAKLLYEYGKSEVDYPKNKTLLYFFEEQVKKTPNKVAVVYNGNNLTFEDLNKKANQLAHHLRSKKVKQGSIVAICIERSLEAIIAIYGVLKTGAAFVPIDTDYPASRIKYILEDTAVNHLILKGNGDKFRSNNLEHVISLDLDILIISENPSSNLDIQILPTELLYILYTSGSTGMPKGVMISHQSMLDHLYGVIPFAKLASCESFLLTSSFSADGGYTLIFTTAILGKTLHVISQDLLLNSSLLKEYIVTNRIDCIKTVPSLWLSYAQSDSLLIPNVSLILGGEIFPLKIIEYLRKHNYKGSVYNNYGPTETTIGKVMHEVNINKNYTCIPIGKPISNTFLYIVNNCNQICPIGVSGELLIGGDGVGRGYLNRDALTDEKFVKGFFNKEENQVIYRTGDIVKWLPEGEIEYIGRVDEQIQIRGYRVEVKEIESVILTIDSVRQAIVITSGDDYDKHLTAFIVGQNIEVEFIKNFLKEKLPDYMIPSSILFVDEIPLTSNAKADKNKLLKMIVDLPEVNDEHKSFTPLEKELYLIWKDVLKVNSINLNSNFFELGGHSLKAVQLISAIHKQLLKKISVKDLFLNATISELAKIISKNENERDITPKIVSVNKGINSPLSFSQERLWFLDKLQGSTNYHVPIVLKLKGNLSSVNLENALRQIITKHEILRTIFVEEEGIPFQKVLGPEKWQLNIINTNLDNLSGVIDGVISKPFDLAMDFLLRTTLVKTSESQYVLIIVMHHIITDGWSRSIFINELVSAFNSIQTGQPVNLKALPLQYGDYALWQHQFIKEDQFEKKLAYWVQKLKDIERLNLPLDFVRPAIQTHEGTLSNHRISKKLSSKINSFVLEQNVSLFMFLLSAFKVLLYKYTSQHDISIGTSSANRPYKEVEDLIGFFVNTLVIRSDLSNNPNFIDFLHDVKETCFEAIDNQDVPLEKIINKVTHTIDTSRNPLFDIFFSLNNNQLIDSVVLDNIEIEYYNHVHKTAQFDLSFNISETISGIDIVVEYNINLYQETTIINLLRNYAQLLEEIIINPNQRIDAINMLTKYDNDLILGRKATVNGFYFNEKAIDLNYIKPLNVQFEEVAFKQMEDVAIIHNDMEWSYADLNSFSNQLANALQEITISTGECVGVYMDRSPELIGSLLGILKQGAVYVPLDTQNPTSRIEQVIKKHGIRCIVTENKYLSNLLAIDIPYTLVTDAVSKKHSFGHQNKQIKDIKYIKSMPCNNVINKNEITDWAYVLFTSGSTGEPKGAITRHDGAMNHILAEFKIMGIEEKFNFLQSANIGSDISVWQMISPLMNGGSVIIVDKFDVLDFAKMVNIIEKHKVNLVEFVPSYMVGFINYIESLSTMPIFSSLDKIMFTGEVVSVKMVNSIKRLWPHIKQYNCYGPCETSDDVLQFEILQSLADNKTSVPIGRPLANMNIIILDQNMGLCPIDVVGEIYIGGIGVGPGYLNDLERTQQSFIPNMYEDILGDILYKSGDLGRWRIDGTVEFYGRKDNQVKIRGNRVELEEIESFIMQLDYVKDCQVLIIEKDENIICLVAFVVPVLKVEKLSDMLKDDCGKLPSYMIPSDFMLMESFPTNLSDKIDKKALINHFLTFFKKVTLEDYPLSDTEILILKIWRNVLQTEMISVRDNFFQIGGHSLLATRVIFKIREEFDVDVPLISLFEYSTVESYAKYLSFLIDENEPTNIDSDIFEL